MKGKTVPLQACTGPEGSRKLRFPNFVTTARDGGRLSALRTSRLYPQEILLLLISVRGWVDPSAKCYRKDIMSIKNPLTPAGIEPPTYRFVVQHLNHCIPRSPNQEVEHNISVFSLQKWQLSAVFTRNQLFNNYYCNDVISHNETRTVL